MRKVQCEYRQVRYQQNSKRLAESLTLIVQVVVQCVSRLFLPSVFEELMAVNLHRVRVQLYPASQWVRGGVGCLGAGELLLGLCKQTASQRHQMTGMLCSYHDGSRW
jgi:hypothetical protein